ncbi:MBL fold metallo-hydrolase [Limibacter armeniacum]|uniref:MBL fold metallo-hydrolase n=1 Tax=Limibacter armeniacum TaxID=466084 RepID=UPI002FE5179B
MTTTETFDEVQALRMGKKIFGVISPIMYVRCYAVDGLLIDSGLSCFTNEVLSFATAANVNQVVITHHHEDHSGNALALTKAGYPVLASSATNHILSNGFGIHFYQQVVWAPAPVTSTSELGSEVKTNRYNFQVINVPGHATDQVALYEPEKQWLFSADAFLADKVKYFRKDEDFLQSLDSVQKLSKLKVKKIFCCHRPTFQDAETALKRKLDFMLNLKERTISLKKEGYSIDEITLQLLGKEDRLMYWFTAGDVSKRNVIRSILEGPVLRKN